MKRIWPLIALVSLCACTREVPPPKGTAASGSTAPTRDYDRKLLATKAEYPFGSWRSRARFVAIFDTLITELIGIGESASEEQKIACFRHAAVALNDLNRKDQSLIETSEAEQLVGFGNIVATAAGLDPKKYGHGEGPISAGRDW